MSIVGRVMYSDANGTVIICGEAIPQGTVIEILLPRQQKPEAIVQPPATVPVAVPAPVLKPDAPLTVASILAASAKNDGEIVSPEVIARAAKPPAIRRNTNAPVRPPEAIQAAQEYEFNLSPEAQAELRAIHREQSTVGGGSKPMSVFVEGADPRAEHGVAPTGRKRSGLVSVFDR